MSVRIVSLKLNQIIYAALLALAGYRAASGSDFLFNRSE